MKHTPERIPVLALWSAPRCRSTAFARMMAERDGRVVGVLRGGGIPFVPDALSWRPGMRLDYHLPYYEQLRAAAFRP